MKLLISIIFIISVENGICYGQDDVAISLIKDKYNKWQTELTSTKVNSQAYYHSVWGNQYELESWTKFELGDTVTLYEVAKVFNVAGLGHLVTVESSSIAGDWVINAENYYDELGDLYFIYWTMNTFHAEIPATIERRLYFDSKNGMIKQLQTIYKMNTKEKVDIGFNEREVKITKKFDQIDFLN